MNTWLSLNGNEQARTFLGKICHLQGVPEEDILTFPDVDPVTQIMEDNIVLKGGKSWNIIKLMSSGKAFTEESEDTPGGRVVNQQVSGLLFGVSEYNHLQVNNWQYRRWVLLLREVGSGITYVIGHPSKGARFSFSYDNGNTTLTRVMFNKTSTSRAIIYQGTLAVPGGGSSSPSTVRMTKEFLVGDVGYMAAGDTQYGHADLIGASSVAVYVDGIRIKGTVDPGRLYFTFNTGTGIITFSAALALGQLVTIDYE